MISDKDVKKIAGLAKLEISEAEVSHFAQELSKIMVHMDKLAELDLKDVAATSHAVDLINVFRADTRVVSHAIEDVLKYSPDPDAPYFAVPKVI